jgi:DNA-binding protein HU-beta
MNKTELIDAIAEKASLTKVDAKKFLDAFLEVTTISLVSGDQVVLTGFGTFSVIERGARTGRNLITGEALEIPAKKIVRFKPGSKLRENVN